MTTPQQLQSSERRIDLDWVRILAFGLLIFYHVGMLYVSWGFHIKSVHRLTWLEPLMLFLNPWRLSLLFLVSGVATRFMLGWNRSLHCHRGDRAHMCGCVVTYEAVWRIAWLRTLFGLRAAPRTVARMEQHQPA
nr:hypothetical protein [Bradyrhizobium diazoefficiens]